MPQTKWDPVNSMWVPALRPVGVNGSQAANGTIATWSIARFAVGGRYICLVVLWCCRNYLSGDLAGLAGGKSYQTLLLSANYFSCEVLNLL